MRRADTFVGRTRELAELRDALADAENDRGRLFLISGEPGIGKTRLVNELSRVAKERGIRTVWGRCWEGEGAPAYWPWIQVLRSLIASLDATDRGSILESEGAAPMVETVARIVPELYASAPRATRPPQGGADAAQTQFRLFDSVAGLLKEIARHGPIAILLDDLHDADNASLTMLRFVARESAAVGILIVGTYRDQEVQRSPGLSQQLGSLGREARSLPLAGLSPAEIAQFFNEVVGRPADAALVEELHDATAGNPLFVDGIVRTLVARHDRRRDIASPASFSTPHTLREAIARRLGKLSDDTRAVLEIAATVGNEFDTAICVRAMGISREEINSRLDEAARDGIVIALSQGRYRFAHALIRASIYEALDTNTRVRFHGAIGTAIEEHCAENVAAHLDELAHHFREACIREKAIDYSHRAGVAAREVFAYGAAVEHWRSALALTEGQRDARRANLLFRLGEAEAFFIDPPRGIAHLEEALSLDKELNDDAWVASINVTLGLALVFLEDFAPGMNVARSLEHFRRAQQWQGEWPDPTSRGWLHQGMAVALFQQVRIEEALASAQCAMAFWREASNPIWLHSGAHIVQLLSILGRHRESAAMLQEVFDALQGIRDPGLFHTVTWYAAWTHMTMQRPLEARRLFSMAAERPGAAPNQRGRALEFLAMTENMMGNSARVKEIAAAHQVNPQFQAAIAMFDGDFEGAIELQRTMIEWGRRTGHLWDVATSLPGLAGSIRLAGDPTRALGIVNDAIRSYQPSDYWFEMGVRPLAATLELEAGQPDRADAHLQVCRDILAQGEDWSGRAGLAYRGEGRLAAAQGRPFDEHFEKAIAIFKRYSLPLDEADTLTSWGTALLARGNRTEAEAKFDAAIEIYRRCGAGQRWIDRVETARNNPASARAAFSSSQAASSVCRREGDYWGITHNGTTSRLRNIKGLGYIAHLLGRPGERVHVIDLVQAIEGVAGGRSNDASTAAREGLQVQRGLGDAGEVLDAQARDAYRRRQSELHAELDAAERDNDPGRAEVARHELELLTDELTAAVGRGGRARKELAHAERARSLVTKHIRTGLDLIRRHNPALATHLDRSIQTGSFCAYLPEAGDKPFWQF